MKARASNPGAIRIDYLRIVRHEPFWPIALLVSTVGLIALARLDNNVVYALGAVVGFALLWIYLVFHFLARRLHFEKGDVNISKVLSVSPPLFATSTNMETGRDNMQYPVVKIVRGKVPGARGMRWKVGDRFAAACMYSGALGNRHWDDFEPLPISMATDRIEVLTEHTQRLEYLFEELDLRLSLVPDSRKPGLYFLDAARLASLRSDRGHGQA